MNSSWVRAIKYTPAVTIVAACINALTGVGPAMASGSQVCKGNCADFPSAPPSNSIAAIIGNMVPCAHWLVARSIKD